MKEKIAHALTSLCIGDPEFILRDKIIEVFFQSSKVILVTFPRQFIYYQLQEKCITSVFVVITLNQMIGIKTADRVAFKKIIKPFFFLYYKTSVKLCFSLFLFQIKEVELQFAIGECLSCIGAGQSSKVFKQYYNIELGLKIPKADVMVSLIQKMTKETVQSPLASIRQAGIIWLLSMVQFSGSHPVLKQEIKQIQKAFMKCLCDSDEITQDVASRGRSSLTRFVFENFF